MTRKTFEELIEQMAQHARAAYHNDEIGPGHNLLAWDQARPSVREQWRKVARRMHAFRYSTVEKETM